jgi:hypothetical protein
MRRLMWCAMWFACVCCGEVRPSPVADAQPDVTDAPSCTPSPIGVQARWRGENNAQDETRMYDGVTSGTYTSIGRYGSAFLFNGAQIFTADNGDQLWPNTSFSLEAWFKTTSRPSSNDYFKLVEKYGCGGSDGCDLSLYVFEISDGGHASFHLRTSDSTEVSIKDALHDLIDGAWHHVVGVRDVGIRELRLYVDGVRVVSSTISGVDLDPLSDQDGVPDPFTIGAGRKSADPAPSHFFIGAVDEVALYFSALDDNIVTAIYTAPDGICRGM